MKTIRTISIIAVLAAATMVVAAQDYPEEYLGLPGDNLNLYAVMNLFQESETLEGFERSLNDEKTMINNLDLNGDNFIDYITVSDYVEGNVHTIVLRASLDRKEQQDIAVFVVEKLRDGEVEIQLIGDEALYGQNYIIEPNYAETPNPGYTGNASRRNANVVTTTYYDVAYWPVVRYMYLPGYRVWRSSWYWGYYPSYWHPWTPFYWHYYYGYHYHWHNHYYSHYRHWNHYRCRAYTTYYRPHVRVYSPTVVVNVNKGQYRSTYSRPDQRRAGEELYTRNASRGTSGNQVTTTRQRSENRSGTQSTRQGVQRTNTSRENTAVRSGNNSVQRSTGTRTTTGNSVQRTTGTRSTNGNSVQRSTGSQPTRSTSVQRSTSSSRKSTGNTVQRSQPNRSNSSVQRSQPNRSSSSVQRSNSSSRKSSGNSVQRSQPSRSKSVQRSSSGSRKSSGSSVQRSSSSSRKSSGSNRSSGSRSSSSRSSGNRSSSSSSRR